MAVEPIGTLYPTHLPGLADAADIQAALRAYHYGSYTYNTANSSYGSLEANSMAKFLFDIETDITALENRPASGGEVNTAAPTAGGFTPAEIPDGFVWVDEDGSLGGVPTGATAVFTNSAPVSSLTTGTIWVDKDETAITANPFIPQAVINAKGDLLAGTANDTATVLSIGTNGQLLKADSSTASGLAWTNTLTSPVISGTTTTASGNLAILPASYIVEVQGGGSTEGQIQLNCAANTHGQKLRAQTHAQAASNTLLLPGGTTIGNSDAVLVSNTGTQTLTNKTLTSPVISAGTIADSIVKGLNEDVNVVASAATGTINIDITTASIWYYTSSATANHTLNFRYSSGVSLDTFMATGDSLTVVWLNTNGASAYYPNAFTIDGNAVTPKVPAAITAGNVSAIDAYSFTIIKTASATFTVLETQTKFA